MRIAAVLVSLALAGACTGGSVESGRPSGGSAAERSGLPGLPGGAEPGAPVVEVADGTSPAGEWRFVLEGTPESFCMTTHFDDAKGGPCGADETSFLYRLYAAGHSQELRGVVSGFAAPGVARVVLGFEDGETVAPQLIAVDGWKSRFFVLEIPEGAWITFIEAYRADGTLIRRNETPRPR